MLKMKSGLISPAQVVINPNSSIVINKINMDILKNKSIGTNDMQVDIDEMEDLTRRLE